MVLAIIFLVLFAICAGISIYQSVSLVKTPMVEVDYKRFIIKSGAFVIGSAICFLVAAFGLAMWTNATLDFLHGFELAVGSLLFVASLFLAINAFIIHYYGRNIPEKLDKWLFRFIIIGFCVALVMFFIFTNGLAPYLEYPFYNGISFTQGLVRPTDSNSPNIAFYALCILSGAILVYFICDHYMYKEYGQHGILESTFFVAFPSGILGARIAYVVGEWGTKFDYGHKMTEAFGIQIWAPLAIWEGGLTILGGAIGGIVVGALWYMWRNKGKSIWIPFDLVLPTILIAQAVGRWGNFFNCEVHGYEVAVDNWKWLPEIIYRNAIYSSDLGYAAEGNIFVPLFFIEAIVNLLGFFVLAHVFGKALRKYTEMGDIGFGYIVWYGLTRMFMEPLRHPAFQMGEKGYWSWLWSMVFVAVGTLAIVINHIVRSILRKKRDAYHVEDNDKKVGLIASIVIGVIGIALIVTGATLMVNNQFETKVLYNGFNIGLIILVLGSSIFLCLGISLKKLIFALKKPQHE
ncbi:MAG: prolipoprotein diacylglyceryl transferase [Bacilli bacterium]|nr:prolipoprotein diacylglyceryl transferase [Bacilli bacterium]